MAITNTKYKGRNLVLKIGDSAVPGTAAYTTIGGVRAKGFSSSVEEIDISDGDDGAWKKLLEGGMQSISVNVSGLVSNNASYELLRSKHQTGALWAFQLSGLGDGDDIKGLFLVSSLEENGEYNGAQQFSATLVGADEPTHTNV
jgi:TP901-1 family phage major tail protein